MYSLDDAEGLNREAPGSFLIPPRQARENLLPGEFVKLLFRVTTEDSTRVERMWVRVDERVIDGYIGTLDNDARTNKSLVAGERVRFGPEHVIAIYEKLHEA